MSAFYRFLMNWLIPQGRCRIFPFYSLFVAAPPEIPHMSGTDKRKQSLYFPEDMLKEIQEEANRQDRSLSWVVQQAWKIARERIKSFPAVNDVAGAPDSREER